MSSESAFTVAVITSYDPVAVTIQEFDFGQDGGPDDVFDDASAPRVREYPFDLNRADSVISSHGYERTAGWRWTGTCWGAVAQLQADNEPMTEAEAALANPPRAWEQGGYDEPRHSDLVDRRVRPWEDE